MNYFPGVVEVPEEDDPGVVEVLPEVEFTLLVLSFLSFLSFFAFLSVLVELVLFLLVLELEFVVSLGELTPGLLALPDVDGEVWAIANGLRLIERAGTSKNASLFFMLLAPSERRCSYANKRSRYPATVRKLPSLNNEMESKCHPCDRYKRQKKSGVYPRRSFWFLLGNVT